MTLDDKDLDGELDVGDSTPADRLWIPFWSVKPRRTTRDWLLTPVTLPLSLLGFFLLGAYILIFGRFVIPFFLLWNAHRRRLEHHREAHFRVQGRLITWESLEETLEHGEGIMVVEPHSARWWIPEEPASHAPLWRPEPAAVYFPRDPARTRRFAIVTSISSTAPPSLFGRSAG